MTDSTPATPATPDEGGSAAPETPGGLAGFDMNALLEQAQAMQASIMSAQDELANATVEGTVAGGAVRVSVNGVGEIRAVDIKAGEFDGTDPDSLADLGDLIVAAYRDAKARADVVASDALGPMTGGFGGLGGAGGPDAPGSGPFGFTP